MKLLTIIATLTFSVLTAHASEALKIEVSSIKPQAQTISYHFGRRMVNTISTMRFDITNNGYEPLRFEGAYVYGGNYQARHNCNNGLPAKSRCWIEVRYWPMFEGIHSGEAQVNFSGQNDIRILLWGEAVRY